MRATKDRIATHVLTPRDAILRRLPLRPIFGPAFTDAPMRRPAVRAARLGMLVCPHRETPGPARLTINRDGVSSCGDESVVIGSLLKHDGCLFLERRYSAGHCYSSSTTVN